MFEVVWTCKSLFVVTADSSSILGEWEKEIYFLRVTDLMKEMQVHKKM